MNDATEVPVNGEVFVTHHMLLARNEDQDPMPPSSCPNGLVAARPGLVVIYTGTHTGKIAVAALVTTLPPEASVEGWDEVVEISFEATEGDILLGGIMSEAPQHFPDLAPGGPGSYRMRVHARGRDTNIDGATFEPVEEYLIIVWPAPPAPEVVYKLTDTYGASRRRRAAAKGR